MSCLNLTQEEIRETTGKQRYSAQLKALRAMGIDAKTRPDGRPIVSRAHYERIMSGEQPGKTPDITLNFDHYVTEKTQ